MRRTSSKGVEVVYTDSADQIFGVVLEEIAITDLSFPWRYDIYHHFQMEGPDWRKGNFIR